MPTNILAEISKEFISESKTIADVVTFVESSWGLGIKLLPVQRFILKCLYGLPLDNGPKTIDVPDVVNEHTLYRFNEKEFLAWLYAEGRCNTDETEGRIFQEIILAIGRRGTKCRDRNDLIATTDGTLSFGELLGRLKARQRIGIQTYDPNTLTASVSYDLKAQDNRSECFELTTARGICETSSWNHPYLIWRPEWEKPDWVEMCRLRAGDKIATSKQVGLFGQGGVGVNKAALLGHLQGDGGTTCSVGYTTSSRVMLADLRRLILCEFPEYVVKKKGKSAFRMGYEVVKASGRFKQNGSQKNEVGEWLKREHCFGKKAVEKEVPACIFQGSKAEVAAFLSRLFGCDGHASVENIVPKDHGGVPKSHVGYCSASKKMIDGVRHLLLKFGIHGCVCPIKAVCDGKTFNAWTLRIVRSDSLEKFRNQINIFSKEDAVDRVLQASRLRSLSKSEFDCVPSGVWNYIRRVMKGSSARLRWRYAPSKWKVRDYGEHIGDAFLRAIGSSDVLWDEVESVRCVGMRDTVDVEVGGTHIIGGDIVSHNSTLASCVSNYEMYKLLKYGDPSKYYGFPSFTTLAILNVAPTDEQADIVFEMTQSMAMRCPFMKDRSIHQTMTYFDLQTDPDMQAHGKPRASLLSLAGGCSSNSLRGRNAIVVIMDEMAHFIDNNGRFSGSEVYKALTPSIASFRRDGKVVCISSPYAKFGKFYERWDESFREQEITLAFKMYSAMVNPTIPSEILRAARKRDRVGFMCEYGGEFSDTVTAWIDDEAEFRRCIVNTPAPSRGVHDVQYFFGVDLGFKNDGTGLAIVHREPDSRIILDYANVWYSGSSDVWEFSDSIYRACNKYASLELLRMADIVEEIKELVKWFPPKAGVFDQHNGYALAEAFQVERMSQFQMENFSDTINDEVYRLVKRLYAEQFLTLFDHPVLVREMLSLEAERKSSSVTDVELRSESRHGKMVVRQPNRRGAHNDISDAFCRAVWLCYNTFKETPPRVVTGVGGRVPSLFGKTETQASFVVKRMKQHGDHPRGLYRSRYKAMLLGR